MSCKTILPTNIDKRLNALDLVGCERLEEIKKALEKVKYFNDPLKIDEKFLELVADEYESKFWSPITQLEKRKLINTSKFYYRKIGTIWAIKEVLKVLEIDSKLKEWFDYEGDPYHFKVILSPTNKHQKFDDNEFKKIVSLIDSVKNVRSVLDGFEIELNLYEEVKVYSGAISNIAINQNLKIENSFKERINNFITATSNIKINQNLEIKKEFKTLLNSFSAGVSNININKDLNYETKTDENINFFSAGVSNIKINQNLKVENEIKTNIKNRGGNIFNLHVSTTLNYTMEVKNENNLQGAVIWQV